MAGLPSMKATAPALIGWARAHAEPLGLDPDAPVELYGIHVAYRRAADRQPRPEVILSSPSGAVTSRTPACPSGTGWCCAPAPP